MPLRFAKGTLNPRYLDLQSSAFPGFAGPWYKASTTPPWQVNDALNLEFKMNFNPN